MSSSDRPLLVGENFNPEEAASAAAEFVSSLDNLPGEVTFLLEEITEKDQRINLLLNRINTRHFALTKSARQSINSSSNTASGSGGGGASTPPFPLPLPAGASLPTGHLSTKDAQAITKIISEFAKVQALQDEKCALAERMERIVGRARARGKAEWVRVGGLDVEEEADRLREEMKGREGLAGGMVALPSMGLGTGTDRPKKRKPHGLPLSSSSSYINTPHITHPPPSNYSSMPPPPAPRGPGRRRDRHHSATASLFSDADAAGEYDPAAGDVDADAEGEEEDAEGEADEYELEGEAEGGDGDDGVYCTCRQKSYGEMIGCDNSNCDIEWFHVKCVGVTGEAPETWYCPSCVIKLNLANSTGRSAGSRENKRGRKPR